MENEESQAYISYESNIIRVDCIIEGKNITKVFERVSKGILEVEYNDNGSIIHQKLVDPAKKLEDEAKEYLLNIKAKKIITKPYSDVKLNKKCPNCGSISLERIKDGDISIMPIYTCKICGARSYDLTLEYLENLIKENILLFSDEEQKELEHNHAAFVTELNDYILKIYASKKIMHIK
ncbi:MAG: hypothetical protein QW134_06340 [Nitrososphaeria archaeon]